MRGEQVATLLASQGIELNEIERGDPPRIPFVRVAWTGTLNIAAAPAYTILNAPLTLETIFADGAQGSVFDLSQLQQGRIIVKSSGLFLLDVSVRPSMSYTGASGRLGSFLYRPASNDFLPMGIGVVLGDYGVFDAVQSCRLVLRPGDTYMLAFRWFPLVTPSTFSAGRIFATLVWLPARY